MSYISDYGRPKHQFKHSNVHGLPGRVFGAHWHQRSGPKVNPGGSQDWDYDVHIRPVRDSDGPYLNAIGNPTIRPYEVHWAMFESDLATVESGLNFPIREHVRRLISETLDRPPVVLEWGCGAGCAVRDLTLDPEISRLALVFGYGDIWDKRWNSIRGVKFLFFVKEHLPEYFRRMKLKIDFIYTHGAMDYLRGQDFVTHLRALGALMPRGALIVFSLSVRHRQEFAEVSDLFEQSPGCSQAYHEGDPSYLIRR